MSKPAQTNLILFLICIVLFAIAWFKPGLHKETIKYFTSLEIDEIYSIEIQREGLENIKLIKKDKVWFLLEPEQTAANILRINTIIALAKKRSYAQFQVSDKELDPYGLNAPKVSIKLNETDFVIGGKHPVKALRYAMKIDKSSQSANQTIHLIEDKVYYQLRSRLDTFIKKSP